MVIENNKVRWSVVSAVFFLAVWQLAPNFIDKKAWWLAKEKLIYGLDIQGGLHLVLGVNTLEVLTKKLTQEKQAIARFLEEKSIKVQSHVLDSRQRILLQLKDHGQMQMAVQEIESEYGALFQVLSSSDGLIELAYSKIQTDNAKKKIISQSIEVIRNRIDEFGVNEPVITAQGDARILVQLPGIKEAETAKELIQKTAHLEMQLVSEKLSLAELSQMIASAEEKGNFGFKKGDSYRAYLKKLNEDLKDKIPENTIVAFMQDKASKTLLAGRTPMLLETDTGLDGSMLEDAVVGRGQFGEPTVDFSFGVEGAKRLSEVTSKNIGRAIAVVLDGVIKTAPVIQDHLPGRGVITLGSGNRDEMLKEATMISTVLRAGALPASLEQLEERTVGPTLGRDHIAKGQLATLVALALVLVFLLIYYRWIGIAADIALVLNMTFLLSILTSFGAALTLPGVAGIILTVGMAVDANIIIFERIKEELKKGASLKLAVSDGFGRAFSAILDANITTGIVCLVLMYFGTGPIKGFAVTLFCGIITSVFTAVFVSRTMINTLIHRFKFKGI